MRTVKTAAAVALLAMLVPTSARADVFDALVAKLRQPASADGVTLNILTITSGPLICVTLTKKETDFRKRHSFACATVFLSGDALILGGVLDAKGNLYCRLDGVRDGVTGCYALTGCGLPTRVIC